MIEMTLNSHLSLLSDASAITEWVGPNNEPLFQDGSSYDGLHLEMRGLVDFDAQPNISDNAVPVFDVTMPLIGPFNVTAQVKEPGNQGDQLQSCGSFTTSLQVSDCLP